MLTSHQLFQAIDEGSLQVVQQYIEDNTGDPAALNIQDERGNTALMRAVEEEQEEIVKALLAVEETDAYIKNNDGETAIRVAAINGNAKIIQILLSHSTEKCKNENSMALKCAVGYGHIEVVRKMVDNEHVKHININAQDDDGYTALIWAARNQQEEMVKALLAVEGIDAYVKNEEGKTAIMIAAMNGRERIVEILLNCSGYSHVDENSMVLIQAVRCSQKGVVEKMLCSPYLNINYQDEKGNTALIHAVHTKHSAIYSLLLDDGADTKIQNNKGETADSLLLGGAAGSLRFCGIFGESKKRKSLGGLGNAAKHACQRHLSC